MNAGVVFTDFAEKELRAERDRRDVLDGRGSAVLSTSSTLVTIMVALGAFASGSSGFGIAPASWVLFLLALIAFLFAGLFGLLAQRLIPYQKTRADQLRRWRKSDSAWHETANLARRAVTEANITTIDTLRVGNDRKAKTVAVAHTCQLVGLVILTGAIISIAIDVGLGSVHIGFDAVVTVVEVLAWPVVVLTIFLSVRRPLLELLKRRAASAETLGQPMRAVVELGSELGSWRDVQRRSAEQDKIIRHRGVRRGAFGGQMNNIDRLAALRKQQKIDSIISRKADQLADYLERLRSSVPRVLAEEAAANHPNLELVSFVYPVRGVVKWFSKSDCRSLEKGCYKLTSYLVEREDDTEKQWVYLISDGRLGIRGDALTLDEYAERVWARESKNSRPYPDGSISGLGGLAEVTTAAEQYDPGALRE